MAFKMKNPSMAKLTRAAGDNRVAMKLKMEEKAAAAKMKRESAMKMEKESMVKLMDKASAMKRRSDEDDKSKTNKDSEMQQKLEEKAAEGDKMAKLALKYRRGGKLTEEELEFISNYEKESKSATPMKSPMKADISEVEVTASKTEKKPKSLFTNKPTIMKMEGGVLAFKGRGGEVVNLTAESIKPYLASGLSNREKRMALKQLQAEREGGSATKFNAKLKAASKAGRLSGKFKEAVDASPAKFLGKKKKKMNASKTVHLEKRIMYPGDAVFKGSEKSKVDQPLSSHKRGSKSYTHYPEGHGSIKTETAGKRTKVTKADGSTKVTKKRTFGGTKEFAYDAQGNLKSKIKRNRKGDITRAKGDTVFSNKGKGSKTLKAKGRKAKDFSKKEKAALANVKTTYKG